MPSRPLRLKGPPELDDLLTKGAEAMKAMRFLKEDVDEEEAEDKSPEKRGRRQESRGDDPINLPVLQEVQPQSHGTASQM